MEEVSHISEDRFCSKRIKVGECIFFKKKYPKTPRAGNRTEENDYWKTTSLHWFTPTTSHLNLKTNSEPNKAEWAQIALTHRQFMSTLRQSMPEFVVRSMLSALFYKRGRVKRRECSFVLGDANLGRLLTIATERRLLRKGALRAEREKRKKRGERRRITS